MRTCSAGFQEKRLQRVCETFERVWKVFAKGLRGIWKGLRSICKGFEKHLQRVWEAFAKGLRSVWNTLQTIWQAFPKGLKNVWNTFWAFVSSLWRVCERLKRCQTPFLRRFKCPKNAVFDKTCFPKKDHISCLLPARKTGEIYSKSVNLFQATSQSTRWSSLL